MSEASSSSERPAFRGKTVVISTRTRSQAAPLVLSDCSFVVVGGRLFLVGTGMPVDRAGQEWSDGLRHRIAWDSVEEYLLFDTADDYYALRPVAATESLGMGPLLEFPLTDAGKPVEPSEIYVDAETPLEVGSIVLAFSQGRWWRAQVVEVEDEHYVRIHYPGWDEKWDETVEREQLQVDLSTSLEADDAAEELE